MSFLLFISISHYIEMEAECLFRLLSITDSLSKVNGNFVFTEQEKRWGKDNERSKSYLQGWAQGCGGWASPGGDGLRAGRPPGEADVRSWRKLGGGGVGVKRGGSVAAVEERRWKAFPQEKKEWSNDIPTFMRAIKEIQIYTYGGLELYATSQIVAAIENDAWPSLNLSQPQIGTGIKLYFHPYEFGT
nr:hypothetical protein Iba_chr12bCG19970 [Ipomoea batatas]